MDLELQEVQVEPGGQHTYVAWYMTAAFQYDGRRGEALDLAGAHRYASVAYFFLESDSDGNPLLPRVMRGMEVFPEALLPDGLEPMPPEDPFRKRWKPAKAHEYRIVPELQSMSQRLHRPFDAVPVEFLANIRENPDPDICFIDIRRRPLQHHHRLRDARQFGCTAD